MYNRHETYRNYIYVGNLSKDSWGYLGRIFLGMRCRPSWLSFGYGPWLNLWSITRWHSCWQRCRIWGLERVHFVGRHGLNRKQMGLWVSFLQHPGGRSLCCWRCMRWSSVQTWCWMAPVRVRCLEQCCDSTNVITIHHCPHRNQNHKSIDSSNKQQNLRITFFPNLLSWPRDRGGGQFTYLLDEIDDPLSLHLSHRRWEGAGRPGLRSSDGRVRTKIIF